MVFFMVSGARGIRILMCIYVKFADSCMAPCDYALKFYCICVQIIHSSSNSGSIRPRSECAPFLPLPAPPLLDVTSSSDGEQSPLCTASQLLIFTVYTSLTFNILVTDTKVIIMFIKWLPICHTKF